MSMSNEAVKKTAKVSLTGRWPYAITLSVIIVFAVLISQYVSALFEYVMGKAAFYIVGGVITVFVVLPLILGLLRCFWRNLFGVKDKAVSLFYYFSSKEKYKKSIRFIFVLGLRFVLCGIVFYLPSWLADFFSGATPYNMLDISMPIWASNLWLVSGVLEFAASVALLILVLKYYLAPVLFVADENIDVSEAVHMSTIISKGSYSDFLYLFFSFIGWLLLSLLLIPIPFTLPYLLTVYLVHSRFAVAKYNKHIAEISGGMPTFSPGEI